MECVDAMPSCGPFLMLTSFQSLLEAGKAAVMATRAIAMV